MKTRFLTVIGILTLLTILIGFLLVMSNINDSRLFSDYNPLDGFTCMIKGGDYFIGGEYVVCQMPVSDEGSQCTDMSQCEDTCKAKMENDTVGICTVFSHGCDLVLNHGSANWLCS